MGATFTWNPKTDEVTWSDGLFELYGYAPGSVRPTLRLALEHKHPADRSRQQQLLKATRRELAPYVYRHRIVTAADEVRDVVVAAYLSRDATGGAIQIIGTLIDLTDVVIGPSFDPDEREATELRKQVANLRMALESRDLIGQAKGILMHTYGIGADEAFELIRTASQQRNRKVSALCEEIALTGVLTVD